MPSSRGFAGAVLGGRYQLAERLGAGGMAEVYRAEDLVLDRPVAVKLLHPGAEAAGAARERLRSEVRLLARLSHPGLVSVYDAGEEAGRAFLVMQLVEGGTLAERLASGPLPVADTVRVGVELGEVFAHLHAQDLVHRDIKPSNVLLAPEGRVFLADFGIARAIDATRLTATDSPIGTAAYMAPEQVQGYPVGPAADVYALGLLLIECLSGRPAYEGGNSLEVAMARLHRPPRIPSTGLPAPLIELLEAMTDGDPARRPTAEEVTSRLRGLLVPALGQADRYGPHATAVLQTHPALTEGNPRLALEKVTGGMRSLWRRGGARRVLGLPLNVVAGLALLVAVLTGFAVSALPDRPAPAGPERLAPPTAPPGPQRLPEDLDRLDKAVAP